MRLVLQSYGLRKSNTFIYVGFSGPSLNGSKFYKDDNGVLMGYEEVFDRKSFTI